MPLYESTYKSKHHFSFGQNWKNFLKNYNADRLAEAEKSLATFLGGKEALKNKTFVDIGCGSGLFSLAAKRLGAKQIVSVDIDDASVWCAEHLKREEGSPSHWEIKTGSALDKQFVSQLKTFDVVYSWGVLHHTGDMWNALVNVMKLVNNDGIFYVALYNDNPYLLEGTSRFWVYEKRFYNQSPWLVKKIIDLFYSLYYIVGLAMSGMNPIAYVRNYTSLRGMSFYTDIKDWLGGYPYEYASKKQVCDFFTEHNFTLVNFRPARSIGCNEFLFKKSTKV